MLFFNLLNLDRFRRHLLLHDVGLDLVGFVGLGLLLLDGFQVSGFLDFQVALRLRLLGHGERLSQHALLIGLRLGDSRLALRHGALDGGITLGFG